MTIGHETSPLAALRVENKTTMMQNFNLKEGFHSLDVDV